MKYLFVIIGLIVIAAIVMLIPNEYFELNNIETENGDDNPVIPVNPNDNTISSKYSQFMAWDDVEYDNNLIFQVFSDGEGVYYDSELLPVSEDRLSEVLANKGKNKIWAWMTTLAIDTVYQNNPDWRVVGYDNKEYTTNTGWYDRVSPCIDENIENLENVFYELASTGVDGILIQDDFYLGENEDLNPACQQKFRETFNREITVEDLTTNDYYEWRSDQLYNVLEKISSAARKANPDIEIAVNIYPSCGIDQEECYDDHSQKISKTLEHADYVVLMAYIYAEGQGFEWLYDVTKGAIDQADEDSVIIKLQTVNWNTGNIISDSDIRKAELEAQRAGAKYIAYFPADPRGVTKKGIVIFNMDDVQETWLQDLQVKLVETHIDHNIDVVLGVIPANLDSMKINLKDWNDNHNDVVEIAQHGYSHSETFSGNTYDDQYRYLKAGKDIFESIGIKVYTYIPPFSEYDAVTINAINNLGFHTFLEEADVHFPEGTIKEGTVKLCEGHAGKCELKDPDDVISEINEKIANNGVAIVTYHMQDFADANENLHDDNYNKLIELFDEIQDDYEFMTTEEYYSLFNS